MRFQEAGARIVRLPYFLGAFRQHPQQKTSTQIADLGRNEIARLRMRVHGREIDTPEIAERVREIKRRAAYSSRLLQLGIRR